MALNKTILEYWKNQLSSNIDTYTKNVKKYNAEINAFVKFNPQTLSNGVFNTQSTSAVAGIPFAIKDNIALKDEQLTCASKLLENFVSPITATAVQQLLNAGAIPVGRTNMDEFGMGSDTTHSMFNKTYNPWDIHRSAGGSSGGSAAAVAAGYVPYALGSDTGGSIRQPANFCGIWGLKPTYGSVSRYGLVAYASSLDVIGIVAEHWKWLEEVFNIIKNKQPDTRDASSTKTQDSVDKNVKKIAMCIPKEIDSKIEKALQHAKKEYTQQGYEVFDVELPFVEYSAAVYLNISTAEASTNLARFDGIRYGERGPFAEDRFELINNARSLGFGDEVKLRVLLGGFALRSGFQDQYYATAQKLRHHIRSELNKLFEQADLIALPTFPTLAFKFDDEISDEFQQKLGDAYSVIANLAGIPAVSTPILFDDEIPAGIQLMAPHYAENRLFNFLEKTSHLFEHKYCQKAQEFFNETGRNIKKECEDVS